MIRYLMALVVSLSASLAFALELQPYSAQALRDAQQGGGAVALHFRADWCCTCVSQEDTLAQLADDPTLEGITVLAVNYDEEKSLRRSLKVRAASTFVVFRGSQEVARSVGQTGAASIWAVLVKALP